MGGIPLGFWMDNAHFIVFALVGLGLFATAWLHFDSYKGKPAKNMLLRSVGFFLLALWALISATGFEYVWLHYVTLAFEVIGLILITIGFYLEPIPEIPRSTKAEKTPINKEENNILKKDITAKKENDKSKFAVVLIVGGIVDKLTIILWILACWRIWLLAYRYMIKDLRGLSWAFLFFVLARFVSLAEIFRDSNNVFVFNLTREYSYLWGLETILMLVAAIILIRWVFFYIRFRLAPQMVITITTITFVIFIIAAVSFTGFLFSASEKNSIEALGRSAAMFEFSLKELASQNVLAAYGIAQRDAITEAAAENNVEMAAEGLGDPLKDINVGGAALTNRSGEVLAAKGSVAKVGDSLIDDPAVKLTLEGKITSTYTLTKLQDVDQLVVRSAYPVVKDAKAEGVVVVDSPVDQAFVDTVKEVTDLDVAINAGLFHSATTIQDKNGRLIAGTAITNESVKKLINNEQKKVWIWSGDERLVSRDYLVSYRSLMNADKTNVASIMVAQSLQSIVDQIAYSMSMAYLISVVLMLLSLFPLIVIARAITRSLKA